MSSERIVDAAAHRVSCTSHRSARESRDLQLIFSEEMHSAGKAAYAVSTAGNAEPNPVENRELIAPDHVRQPYIGLGFKQNFVGGNGDSRFLTAAARHHFRMKESALQRFRIVAKDRCCQISLMHGGCVEGFGPHIVVGSLQFKLPDRRRERR